MRLPIRSLIAILIFAFLVGGPRAKADFVNLSGAQSLPNIIEIYVLDDRVRVVLEIYIEDMVVFHDLFPDDWLDAATIERPPQSARLRRFSEETLQVITDSGETLLAEVKLFEPRFRKDRFSPFAGTLNPTTGQRVAEPPADKRVVYVELDYPFSTRPNELTIIPPLDEKQIARVKIGFIAYHRSVPVIDFRALGRAVTLRLDWADPWYSAFTDAKLARYYKDGFMSFLYVEPYEVRHEVLVRVKDLEQWLELDLRGVRFIEVDELDAVGQKVAGFMQARNMVTIDGELRTPAVSRAVFIETDLKGVQQLESPGRLDLDIATMGIILSYDVEGLPRHVTVDWDLFTDRIERVQTTATDIAGPMRSYVTPDDNVVVWENFLRIYKVGVVEPILVDDAGATVRIPAASIAILLVLSLLVAYAFRRRQRSARQLVLASIGVVALAGLLYPWGGISIRNPLAGPPAPPATAAAEIMTKVVSNLYYALEPRHEAAVMNRLDLAVAEGDVQQVYRESRRALEVKGQNGGRAIIKKIENISVGELRPSKGDRGFSSSVGWNVQAIGGHWGHPHLLNLNFDAIIDVAIEDGAWKVTGLTVTSVRKNR